MQRSKPPALRFWSRFAFLAVAVAATAAIAVAGLPGTIFDNFNSESIGGRSNARSPSFTIGETVHVTLIATHHYFGDLPGTITLSCPPSGTWGPYQATGVNPSGNTFHDFEIKLDIVVKGPATCQVKDSRPDTWSFNSSSQGYGFTRVWGTPIATTGQTVTKPTSTPAPTPQPNRVVESKPDMGPIEANFEQAQFLTTYSVNAEPLQAQNPFGKPVAYAWSLKLECVDAGCPRSPGPKVDSRCNNLGKTTSTNPEFIWHHGETETQGRCNHTMQGPSGHQGVVTLTIENTSWVCRLEYKGTNSGKGSEAVCFRRSVP